MATKLLFRLIMTDRHPAFGLAVVACLALLAGMLPLGIIAHRDRVFDAAQVRQRCHENRRCSRVLQRDDVANERVEASRIQLSSLARYRSDLLQSRPINSEQLKAVEDNAGWLRADIVRQREAVRVSGYIDNYGPLTWSLSFFGLGVILLWQRKASQWPSTRSEWAALTARALIIYLLFTSFNWLRNFLWLDSRMVVSYVHADISKKCFGIQEVLTFAQIFMIALVTDSAPTADYLAPDKWTNDDLATLRARASDVREALKDWMWRSLCVAIAVVSDVVFYWYHLLRLGDKRYLGSAIVMQVLWGWLLVWISTPLWKAAQHWDALTLNFLLAAETLEQEKKKEGAFDRAGKVARELDPFGLPLRIVIGAGSVVTFLSPLFLKL